MLTAAPALAFEGEIDAKSIGNADGSVVFKIRVSKKGDVDVPDVSADIPNMKMPTTEEEAEKMREEWMKKMQQQQR